MNRQIKRFPFGNSNIDTEIRFPFRPLLSPKERWPASRYTQRELQAAVRGQETRCQGLFTLTPAEAAGPLEKDHRLKDFGEKINGSGGRKV
jgi:hypothetical protein